MEGQEELNRPKMTSVMHTRGRPSISSSSFALNHSSATLSPHVLKDATTDTNTLHSHLPLAWSGVLPQPEEALGQSKGPPASWDYCPRL